MAGKQDGAEGWKEYIAAVHELAERPVKTVEPRNNVPISHYYSRHLPQLRTQATLLLNKGMKYQAYMLFLRFVHTAVCIKKHKQYAKGTQADRDRLKLEVVDVLDKLDKLKEELKTEFEQRCAREQEEAERKEREEAERKEREENEQLGGKEEVPVPVVLHEDIEPSAPEMDEPQEHPLVMHTRLRGSDNDTPLINRPRVNSNEIVAVPSPHHPPQMGVVAGVPVPIPAVVASPVAQSSPFQPSKSGSSNNLSLEQSNLRRVDVPGELVDAFVNLAKPNTQRNVETCGLLMGEESEAGWKVTHLLVPPQRGSSDNCETFDEMKIFNAQIALNVVTLGWIHTHPSQTNFLSSIDLHTQYTHQLMLPEAVAIVIAPTDKKSVAVYTIPVPEAMDFLGKCREPGFHEHRASVPLFRDADHAHLLYGRQLKFDVVDLR